ncbi:MAG TPA: insulinase family protein [Planctomycetota bacterium]|nr:insulinase family protein [Planctomycetota bacterium]
MTLPTLARFRTNVALVFALVALPLACRSDGPAAAPEAPATTVEPRAWPHETSDIPVDPRVHFAALDNGLRIAWAANPEPDERCYVRLHVDVGSLAETERERGLAHFLEHLAFNGSENFPAGTLIEWFQSHGMSFGADTNAHTSFSETVYKLDLPEADAETLREGLAVLRDFAGGLLLEPDEVEAEKGVIDGEERERDSPGMRLFERELQLAFAGTRLPERLPIGTRAARSAFDAELVRGFYERWYRPDAMTLVIVGDLGDLDPLPLIEDAFADLRAPAVPLPVEPDVGAPESYARSYAIAEDEVPTVTLTLQRLVPWEEEPPTRAEWVEDLPLAYARSMINLRLSELAKTEAAPFLGAGLSSAEAFEVFDGEALNVTADPERWKEALAFCERELRRALQDGFAASELAEVRANALRSLDEAVEREAKAHSGALVNALLAAAEEDFVPTDARTRRGILKPALEALTPEACHAALVEAWGRGEPSVSATGNLDLGDDAAALLLAAYAESAAVPVESSAVAEAAAFAYPSDPAVRGEIVERREVEDLEFTQVVFANGVRLNVKATDFQEQQILLAVRFGEGRLTHSKDAYVEEWVANQVLGGAGLEAHSVDDLRRLTAGRQVGLRLAVGLDAFQIDGATTPEDLLFELELARATLAHPGWRPDGLVPFKRQVPLFLQQLPRRVQGPLFREFLPALYQGDPRFGLPDEESIQAVEMETLRAWIEPLLDDAPVELSLVGDLDVDAAIDAVAQTVGTLPQRRAWREHAEERVAPAPASGVHQVHAIDTEDEKSLVLVVFPLPDGIDADRRRRFALLDAVLADRIRVHVREELGAAYSPGTSLSMNPVYPDVGSWTLEGQAEPEQADALREALLATAEALANEGVTDEELERQRAPILNQRRDGKRTNGFWIGVLDESQRDPAHLDQVRSGDRVFEATTAEELSALAAEHLQRERASTLIVNPEP